MKKILLLSMLILLPKITSAAEAHDTKCNSPVQTDLMACFNNSFHQSDSKLNKLYQKMIGEAKLADKGSKDEDDEVGTYETKLRNSEKSWVAFRDAECARTSSPNHAARGRESDLDYPQCLKEQTDIRIKQLSANK